MWGTICGAAVFIVMNFVVLPQTAVVKSPLSLPLLLNGVLGHALFVGLPIALAARRITNQSSFSTQANALAGGRLTNREEVIFRLASPAGIGHSGLSSR
jgi:hypothetical protein